MRTKQIIILLNEYVRYQAIESSAKLAKQRNRDLVLDLLPKNPQHEWSIPAWGTVSYKPPKDSVTVDLDRLKAEFPKAYKACVSTKPNSPRFHVNPTNVSIEDMLALTRREAHA